MHRQGAEMHDKTMTKAWALRNSVAKKQPIARQSSQ